MDYRFESIESVRPQALTLSLFEALDAGSSSGDTPIWHVSTVARHSDSSFSDARDSDETSTPRELGDEHPAVRTPKGWSRPLGGEKCMEGVGAQVADSIPHSSRRRRSDRNGDQAEGNASTPVNLVSPIHSYAQRDAHLDMSMPEPHTRFWQRDGLPEQPVLAVSSVRARVGPCGIMSTDGLGSSAPSFKNSGDASTRGVGIDAASRAVPAFGACGDASTRVPPSQCRSTNGMQFNAPQQPQIATTGVGGLGIMSTTPNVATVNPPMPICRGLDCSVSTFMPSAPEFTPTHAQSPSHAADVLISVFGTSTFPSGENLENLAATLLAAQPTMYED